MPIDYVERARRYAAQRGTTPYDYARHEPAPLTPLKKSLSQCRVALIGSGGIYLQSQQAFEDRDDLTFREIPRDTDLGELRIHHTGYNHADAEQDVNCVFPITRLQELEEEGFIGELASPSYALMGRIYSRQSLVKETAPELAARLKERGVDACLLVPA